MAQFTCRAINVTTLVLILHTSITYFDNEIIFPETIPSNFKFYPRVKMRRVRRDNTCISLELFENEDSDLCDKCYTFRQRQEGIGRHLNKNAKPKCEKPWFLDNIERQPNRLIMKKEKFM